MTLFPLVTKIYKMCISHLPLLYLKLSLCVIKESGTRGECNFKQGVKSSWIIVRATNWSAVDIPALQDLSNLKGPKTRH